jgi:hypothetical protein
LRQAVTLMGIPAAGLQITFTQQAAASLHGQHERELASVFRGVLRATFRIWLLMAAVVFVLRGRVLVGLKIDKPELEGRQNRRLLPFQSTAWDAQPERLQY